MAVAAKTANYQLFDDMEVESLIAFLLKGFVVIVFTNIRIPMYTSRPILFR
jgi:hypothetical protein